MNYYQILNWLLISTIWHVSLLQILSGLYIGNFRDSKDLKQLDLHKITHILSIHDDARKLFKVQIAKVFWPLKGGLITESFFFGSNLLNRRWDLQGGKFYWIVVAAAEIRDRETGLVSRPFLWFQSRQIFHETHETEANPIFFVFSHFYSYVSQEFFCKT